MICPSALVFTQAPEIPDIRRTAIVLVGHFVAAVRQEADVPLVTRLPPQCVTASPRRFHGVRGPVNRMPWISVARGSSIETGMECFLSAKRTLLPGGIAKPPTVSSTTERPPISGRVEALVDDDKGRCWKRQCQNNNASNQDPTRSAEPGRAISRGQGQRDRQRYRHEPEFDDGYGEPEPPRESSHGRPLLNRRPGERL